MNKSLAIVLLAFIGVSVFGISYWNGSLNAYGSSLTEEIVITDVKIVSKYEIYLIYFQVNNTGTKDVIISYVVVNGTWAPKATTEDIAWRLRLQEIDENCLKCWYASNVENLIVPYHGRATIWILIDDPTIGLGSILQIRLHTSGGNDITRLVTISGPPKFERLEITSAYVTWNATSNRTGKGLGEWKVTINLRNTGSADATITGLLINGKPWNDASFKGNISDPNLPISLPSEQSATVTFYIAKGGGFNPGVSIEIKMHSASGQDYPKTITLTETYTSVEKIEITSAYATWSSATGNWTVTINLKNTGSADATIQFVLINGKPLSEFGGNVKITTTLPLTIAIGNTGAITLQIKKAGGFQPGVSIEIKLHIAAGQDYPKTITLD